MAGGMFDDGGFQQTGTPVIAGGELVGESLTVNGVLAPVFQLHNQNVSYIAGTGVRSADNFAYFAIQDVPVGTPLTDLAFWEELGEVTQAEIDQGVADYFAANPLVQIGGRAYDSTETYSLGDVVTSGNAIYISIQDNNTGNALTDTTHWMEFISSTDIGGRLWTSTDTYAAGDIVSELSLIHI